MVAKMSRVLTAIHFMFRLLAFFISLILSLLFLGFFLFFLKLAGNSSLWPLISRDFSLLSQMNSFQIVPAGIFVAAVYGVWAVVLLILRMKKTSLVFFILGFLSICISFVGLPMVAAVFSHHERVEKTRGAEEANRKQEEMLKDASKQIKKIETLPLSSLAGYLQVLDKNQDEKTIPYWSYYAKKLIEEWPSDKRLQLKEFAFQDVTEALEKHYGSVTAIDALNTIETALRNSKSKKSRMFFTYLYFAKKGVANPPYLKISELSEERRNRLIQSYEEAVAAEKILYAPARLEKQGDKLFKIKKYNEALSIYKEVLSSPYIFSEEEEIQIGRKFVDAVLALRRTGSLADLEKAILYQKRILKNSLGLQGVHRGVLNLWKLYDEYAKRATEEKISIPDGLIERSFKSDGAEEKARLEKKYDHFKDKSYVFWDLAGYYFRNMNFEKTEKTLLGGAEYAESLELERKVRNSDQHMASYMFRDVLKDFYLILGRYDESLEQIAKYRELSNAMLHDEHFSKRNNLILNEKLDHFVLAVEYAKEHKISPVDLNYVNSFNYNFIEFDTPDWITWDASYDALWQRVKDIK